ncbi:hypothetical protein ILUMI_08502 [Ignelater luminosus]|uniref:Uncharacterized protein n=1 Tax=Ignelater luminosus TaxID=2038154 RepID=A0A8K0GAK7_IGNLU|nr:hypothetical protein ILUMI_08502 [Ignelater luminosus]
MFLENTIHNETNPKGHRLANFAEEMNNNIMSTQFEHKTEHKITWLLPAKATGNQINHELINKRRINMMKDVRSFRGATVDSDHILVTVKTNMIEINTKVKKTKRRTERRRNSKKIRRRSKPEETTEDIEHLEMPTKRECYEAKEKLKRNKAAGPDTINSEQIKNGGSHLVKEKIYKVASQIWDKEETPATK